MVDCLDLTGLRCPEPIMMIRKKIREIQIGESIRILADDPASVRDIPSFCDYMEHQLLSINIKEKPYEFIIKKLH